MVKSARKGARLDVHGKTEISDARWHIGVGVPDYGKHELADAVAESENVAQAAALLSDLHRLRNRLLNEMRMGGEPLCVRLLGDSRDAALQLAAEIASIIPVIKSRG